jgi:hypothetical protein
MRQADGQRREPLVLEEHELDRDHREQQDEDMARCATGLGGARFSRMSFVAREVKVPDQFTMLAGLCARRTGLPGLRAGCSTRSCANAHGDLPLEKAVEERLGRTSSRAPWPHPKPLPSQKHSEDRRALVLEVSLDRQPHPQRRGAEVTSNRYSCRASVSPLSMARAFCADCP